MGACFDTDLKEMVAFVEKDHSKLYNRDKDDQHPINAIEGLQDALDSKVDKEEGKGLSTNDFTDEDKERVEEIDVLKERLDNLKPEDIGAISEEEIGETIVPIGPDGYIPSQYIPPTAYDFVVAYPIEGVEELSKYWLSQTPDGDPLEPEKGKLYCLGKSSASYNLNSLFRWATTTYIAISSGGSSDIEPIPNDIIDLIILGE